MRTLRRYLQYPLRPVCRALHGTRWPASNASNLDDHRHLPSLRPISPPVIHFAELHERSLIHRNTHHVRLLLQPTWLLRFPRRVSDSKCGSDRGYAVVQRVGGNQPHRVAPNERRLCYRGYDECMAGESVKPVSLSPSCHSARVNAMRFQDWPVRLRYILAADHTMSSKCDDGSDARRTCRNERRQDRSGYLRISHDRVRGLSSSWRR